MIIDRDDDPWRGRDDLHRLPCVVIDTILILIIDKHVMARMALVLISVEEIITPRLIPASLFSAESRRPITLQRKTEAIILFEICLSWIEKF